MSTRRARSGGYVLLLVAVVVALLALVLLAVARAQGDLAPALRAQVSEAEHARLVHSLAARSAFLLLTEPVGPRSIVVGGDREGGAAMAGTRSASGALIREIRLDGRFYEVAGLGEARLLVGLQDESGLLDLNSSDEAGLGALLEVVGVQPALAARLAPALADYVDADDLNRANGAEKDSYRRARLPDPPNRVLVNRWSAAGAFGWSELSGEQRDALWALTSAGAGSSPLNINTAPADVLRALLGDERRVEMLLRQRALQPLAGAAESEALTGVRSDAAGVSLATQPGNAFRLVVASASGRSGGWREVESQLVLAGPDAERPYYWREVRRERASARGEHVDNVEPLPESAAMHAP